MRLLASVRLSRATEATTSPETQRAEIKSYAASKGHTVVTWADDMDISGGMPIRERPGIGAYLTDENLASWDGLAVHTLDRAFRDQLDFLLFYRDFCQDNGKFLVSVDDDLDSSTSTGKRILNQRASAAEEERIRMVERRQRAQARIREAARWGGGRVPYGYEPCKDGSYWYLRPHPEHAALIRYLAGQVIAGRSCASLTVELNAKGIPSASGKVWGDGTLLRVLRGQVLRGYVLYHPPYRKGQSRPEPQIVRAPDGMPIQRTPILGDATWTALQTALDRNTVKGYVANRHDAALLLRVVFCGTCSRPLYAHKYSKRAKTYASYRCPGQQAARSPEGKCSERNFPMDTLEAMLTQSLLTSAGSVPMMTRTVIPAEDHAADLARVSESISMLQADRYERGLFSGDAGTASYVTMMTKLETQLATLSALPSRPQSDDWQPTGQTFAEHYESLTVPQRHALLLSLGIEAYAVHSDVKGPTPADFDPDGRTSVVTGDGIRLTVFLGDLATLRDLAAQS